MNHADRLGVWVDSSSKRYASALPPAVRGHGYERATLWLERRRQLQ